MKGIIALSLLSLYTVCEYTAYFPQMLKLVKTRSADDLSITTWLTWVFAGICYLLYVLLESPETGVIFVATMNLIFVFSMCVLTVYYQLSKKLRKSKKIDPKNRLS